MKHRERPPRMVTLPAQCPCHQTLVSVCSQQSQNVQNRHVYAFNMNRQCCNVLEVNKQVKHIKVKTAAQHRVRNTTK